MPAAKLAAHPARQVLHRQVQAVKALGPGLHGGRDREHAAGHELPVGQSHARDGAVLGGLDRGHRGVDDADAAGGEPGADILVQVGAAG